MAKPEHVNGDGVPGLVTFCGIVGALLAAWLIGEDAYVSGFLVGLGLGGTAWLLLATEHGWQRLAILTILGGAWVGAAIGGGVGALGGAFWGSALFVGWLFARLVRSYVVTAPEDADEDVNAA